jgi:hypothetical protein
MNASEMVLIGLLAISNIALGIGLGIYLARKLSKIADPPIKTHRVLSLLIGIYFLECLAFPAGMATQIFVVGLSFLWGIVLGRFLRKQRPIPSLQFALLGALYTCLPTITFAVLVPIAWTLAGNSPFTAEAGISFGIPEWVPWPLGSVAGFATALVLGTVLLKSVIIVGEVSMILHLSEWLPSTNRSAAA